MINEIIVKGSIETTFHDFTFTTNGMDLILSSGTYHQNNTVIYTDPDGGSITIPTTPNMNYEISLLVTGEFHVLQYSDVDTAIEFYKNNKIVDLLAWFTVGENVTSLDAVTINVKKMVTDNAD